MRIDRVERGVPVFVPELADYDASDVVKREQLHMLGWPQYETSAPANHYETHLMIQCFDSRKVQPYYADSLAMHPEAIYLIVGVATEEDSVDEASNKAQANEEGHFLAEALYSASRWLCNLIYPSK